MSFELVTSSYFIEKFLSHLQKPRKLVRMKAIGDRLWITLMRGSLMYHNHFCYHIGFENFGDCWQNTWTWGTEIIPVFGYQMHLFGKFLFFTVNFGLIYIRVTYFYMISFLLALMAMSTMHSICVSPCKQYSPAQFVKYSFTTERCQ